MRQGVTRCSGAKEFSGEGLSTLKRQAQPEAYEDAAGEAIQPADHLGSPQGARDWLGGGD